MAVPPSFSTLDISGRFVHNKALSDDTDEILILQGVGWFLRKAIKAATLTLYINHYTDENDIEHIDIDQRLTGGIPGTTEQRTLDWTEREHRDGVFGDVIGKSRRVEGNEIGEIDEEFLKTGWTKDSVEDGLIFAYARSDTPKSGRTWTSDQVWGIEVINGERRYTRHVHFVGPKQEKILVRLVFDYPQVIEQYDFPEDDWQTFDLLLSIDRSAVATQFRTMSDSTKIVIARVTEEMSKLLGKGCTWDQAVATMENITLIESQDEGRPTVRKSEFLTEGHFLFKTTNDVDETILHDVRTWFADFTRGEDIDFVSLINIASIANSISRTGAAVTGVTSAIWSVDEPTRKSLDIGILRYPDSDNSFFKLYRMKLDVWASRYNVVLTRNYNNGITAELTVRCYKPRVSIINELSSDTKKAGIKAVEAMFS